MIWNYLQYVVMQQQHVCCQWKTGVAPEEKLKQSSSSHRNNTPLSVITGAPARKAKMVNETDSPLRRPATLCYWSKRQFSEIIILHSTWINIATQLAALIPAPITCAHGVSMQWHTYSPSQWPMTQSFPTGALNRWNSLVVVFISQRKYGHISLWKLQVQSTLDKILFLSQQSKLHIAQ